MRILCIPTEFKNCWFSSNISVFMSSQISQLFEICNWRANTQSYEKHPHKAAFHVDHWRKKMYDKFSQIICWSSPPACLLFSSLAKFMRKLRGSTWTHWGGVIDQKDGKMIFNFQLFEMVEIGDWEDLSNIARIANAVQVTIWSQITNPQCHDSSFAICQ